MSNAGILVSSDEERRINDILDRGINEIKSTNNNTNILKSSFNNENLNLNYNYQNYEEGSSNFTGGNSKDAKSSALRQLLDEIKMNNKFVTSSEDEATNIKFKGNSTNVSSGIGRNIQYNQKVLSSEDDEPNLMSPQNLNLKNKFNNRVENNFIGEPKQKGVRERNMSQNNSHSPHNQNYNQDQIDISTNTGFDISNKTTDKNIFNRNLSNNYNTSSNFKDTSGKLYKNEYRNDNCQLTSENELSFHDMKYDMKHLQDKISGLERKLLDGYNSSNLNTKYNLETESVTNTHTSHRKASATKSLTNSNTNRKNRITYNTNIQSEEELNSDTRFNRFNNAAKDPQISQVQPKITTDRREKSQENILSLTRDILNKSSRRSSNSKFKDENNLNKFKDKYEKLRATNDNLKQSLLNERKKVLELTKRNKKMQRKEENYDDLNEEHQKQKENYSDALNRLDESELIRKEQAKLIKSLQREIDMLRGNYNYNDLEGKERLIEDYVYLKKDLNQERELIKMSKKPVLKKKKKVVTIPSKSRSKSAHKNSDKISNNLKYKIK